MRKDNENKEPPIEETSGAENQQIDNLNLSLEENEAQTDTETNEESYSESDGIVGDETETSKDRISYQCSKCGKKFTKKHYAKVHCAVRPLIKCEFCGLMKSSII